MSEPGGDPSSEISSGDALILPERHPACKRREARPGFRTERENLCFVTSEDVKGEVASGSNREGESTEAGRRGGAARSSVEGPVMGLERRGCVVRPRPLANWRQEEPVDEAKPFMQRSNIGSRVTREGHARFWERPEVQFLRATRRVSRAHCLVRRCGTVREMKEGPSRSAVRCRSQATASCCRQERWWRALRKRRDLIPAGKVERGERKRTADEVSKAD